MKKLLLLSFFFLFANISFTQVTKQYESNIPESLSKRNLPKSDKHTDLPRINYDNGMKITSEKHEFKNPAKSPVNLVPIHDPELAVQFLDSTINYNMHITSDGNYFYTINGANSDYQNGRINKYTLSGVLVASYPIKLDMTSLMYNKADNSFYVSGCTSNTTQRNIYKITSLEDGTFSLLYFNLYDYTLSSLSISWDGNYIYALQKGTLRKYNLNNGGLEQTITGLNCGSGPLTGDGAVAVDPDYIYTWDAISKTVYVYDLSGKFVKTIVLNSGSFGPSLSFVDGYIFVAKNATNSVGTWYGFNIRLTSSIIKGISLTYNQIDASSFPTIISYVTVTDTNGFSLSGITSSNFTVKEDEITESPITAAVVGTSGTNISIGLVIDKSGSMYGQPLTDAKSAAKTFLSQMASGDKGLVISFDNAVSVDQDFTDDKSILITALNGIAVGGATAIYDAMYEAVTRTSNQSGRKAVLLLTDGGDNSSHYTIDQAINYAKQKNVPVFTVGLGLYQGSSEETVLKRIAQETGGTYNYSPNSSSLSQIYYTISQQLQNQFLVTYTTHNPLQDGQTRNVSINVKYGNQTGEKQSQYIAPMSANIKTISGNITYNGTGLSGVTVALSGSSTGSYTTTSSGAYSFSVNSGGTYTVTPAKSGYSFNPSSQTFTYISSNQTQNFTASQVLPTVTITGNITYNGAGLDGVTVVLSGSSTSSYTTTSSGAYSFTVNSGGTYTVTPTKSGYNFSPSSQTFTSISSNQTQNFTASQIITTLTITGNITYNGTGLDGVTVALSGSSTSSFTTTSSGAYSFTVNSGGTYTITPVKSGYNFSPSNRTFSNISSNQTQNFTSAQVITTVAITGNIIYNGAGLDGVTVTLSGSSTGSFTTTSSGAYSFTVNSGGTYTVIPTKSGYSFSPSSQTFTNISSNQTQNFTATQNAYSITGKVSFNGGGLGGVTLSLSGSSSGSTNTDADGNYSFAVSLGGSYTLIPTKSGFTFTPASQTFTNINGNQTQNFLASVNTITISGMVTIGGVGIGGVTVTLTGDSTKTIITDTSGNYSFIVPVGKTYTITLAKANYTFTPSTWTISNVTSDQTQIFTGKIDQFTLSGIITDGSNPLSGVIVTLSGGKDSVFTTGTNGIYTFTVNAGGNYTITPTKTNYSFNPANTTFSNLTSNQTNNFAGTLNQVSISGTIADGVIPLKGVTVTLSGGKDSVFTTGTNGIYSFTVNAGGNYTITPTKTYYTFIPENITFSNLTNNQTQNFAGAPIQFSVNGKITDGVNPLSGVTVILSGDKDSVLTTGTNGKYSFTLNAGGNYIITPTKTNYSIRPVNITLNNVESNFIQDFVGTLNQFTISGTITDGINLLSGVTVTLSGGRDSVFITGTNGTYSFTVNAVNNYTITPSKTNYIFNPVNKTFSNMTSNQTQNFIGTLNQITISGMVTDGINPLNGVTVTLSGGRDSAITTGTNGIYSFTVNVGGNYALTPSKSYYIFTPPTKVFSNVTSNQTQNFTGTIIQYIVSGTVTDGVNSMSGVTITLSGGKDSVITTGTNGSYSFKVNAGGNYTITPARTNYTFNPVNKTFNNITSSQTQNFIGTLTQYTLSGTITDGVNPLTGATVTLSGGKDSVGTTLTNGKYSFSVNAGGNYTVTPLKVFFNFEPDKRVFNNLTSNQNNQDFKGNEQKIILDNNIMIFSSLSNGTLPPSQNFKIGFAGGKTLTWTISANASWLDLNPKSGNDNGTITAGINSTNMNGGIYNAIITVISPEASNSPQIINVTYNVITLPNIVIESTQKSDLGSDKVISFSLASGNPPKSVMAFYRMGGSLTYDSIPVTSTSNKYTFTIPKEKITIRGLDYYAKAYYDGFSKVVSKPDMKDTLIPLQIKINSIEPDYKMIQSKYSMVTVPAFDGTTLMNEMINIYGAVDNTKWRILRWTNGKYSEYLTEESLNLNPGDGYWIVAAENNKILLRNCLTTATNEPFIIKLLPGWNQIGNPFLFPVSVSNINIPAGKKVEGILREWNNQTEDYQLQENIISPWTGYFIKNNENDSVEISLKPIMAAQVIEKQMVEKTQIQKNGWKIAVKVNGNTTYTEFGSLKNSVDEWDKNDLAEMPPAPSGTGTTALHIYFPHNEWKECKGNYLRDFREISDNGNAWEIEVTNTGTLNRNFELGFVLNGILPDNFKMLIYDYDFNKQLAVSGRQLTDCVSYKSQFDVNKSTKKIRITVGTEEYIKNDIVSRITQYNLWQNYPNPFNPSTRIEYAIPENAYVTIKIYNSIGQEVSTLINSYQTAGVYSLDWRPEKLPSGLYFYRINANKYTEVKKMLYIR